jgi:glycosyltransferase involved in cell wall biosynthesis
MATATSRPDKSVLVVGTFLSDTSAKRSVCEDLAERLAADGWTVYTTSGQKNRIARLMDMVGTAWSLRDRYRVAQVDVYSGLAFVWAEAVCWVLRTARKPYILSLHGGNLPAFAQRWHGRVQRLLRSAEVVTTPSRYLLAALQSYRDDLCLLPNPLSIRRYPFRLRQQPRPYLIWLRAFHHIYNPALAVEVVAALAGEFPDVRLVMVGADKGDGAYQEAQQKAADLSLAERVEFVSGVPNADVPNWLNKGDIFLNTTHFDNTPISVLEAMACGLCVVSTDVGGIPYLLDDEYDALLVPPNNVQTMANAVRRLLTQPDLAAWLSQHGRTKAESFDWQAILPQWETLLLETM